MAVYVEDKAEIQSQIDDLSAQIASMEATLSSVTSLFRVSALTGTCEEPEVTDAPMTTAEPTMMPTEPMMTEIPTSSTPTLMPSVFSPGYAVDHYNTKCGNFNDPNRTHKV